MHNFKHYAFAVIGVTALALTITLVNTKRAGAQQTEAIARTPGKPSSPVDVMNTPSVLVSNVPLPMFDMDNARQPFQLGNAVFPVTNGSAGAEFTIGQVPAGKRLVIEYVSGQGITPVNERLVNAYLRTSVGGTYVNHYLVLNDQGVSTFSS
ncbi:MAG TPA: hypothetical protein VE961_02425, partial [Pyrinomonadaceae bacterium]|nr:hypothetical protein [Pyrinomonadaceae bacterium]